MRFILNSLSRSILSLGLVGILAAVAVGGSSHMAKLDMLDRAHEVFVAKDVVADILPPPRYIIEAYLVVLQAQQSRDAASAKALANRLDQLARDFEQRSEAAASKTPDSRSMAKRA